MRFDTPVIPAQPHHLAPAFVAKRSRRCRPRWLSLRTSTGRLEAPGWARADARFRGASGSPASVGRVGQRWYLLSDRRRTHDRHGSRVRAMMVVLWRAGLRIQEALALAEHDLDHRRGSVLVRNGKGGRRREVGMDEWGWEQLRPWLNARAGLPVGPLFCIIDGPTRGRPWSGAAVRSEFRRIAVRAGVRRRFAPHQLRHAHALELAREGVPLNIIQWQLGHANLGTT